MGAYEDVRDDAIEEHEQAMSRAGRSVSDGGPGPAFVSSTFFAPAEVGDASVSIGSGTDDAPA